MKIFWLVGEKSGDLHAAKVMEKLNLDMPNLYHFGIGGQLMLNQGLQAIFPFEKFSVMGFAEVIKDLPFFLRVEKQIKKILAQQKPDLVILVDYPGMNLRIAKIAHKLNLRVLYYICPQFWAWKKYRVLKLKKYCDYVACIFPFEKSLLDKYNINSAYVGHPITEAIDFKLDKEQFALKFNLDINKKWICFFPGSRGTEVKKLLPIYIQTIDILKKEYPDYQFLISKVNTVSEKLYENCNNDTYLIKDYNYEMMKYSDFLIVKSGTSTIESVIIGTPFIIVYKANYWSYWLAKMIIKVKYIGMPNIIFDTKVIPELIQSDVNPQKIIDNINTYMNNPSEYNNMVEEFKRLYYILGNSSASNNLKNIIKKIMEV